VSIHPPEDTYAPLSWAMSLKAFTCSAGTSENEPPAHLMPSTHCPATSKTSCRCRVPKVEEGGARISVIPRVRGWAGRWARGTKFMDTSKSMAFDMVFPFFDAG